MTLEQHVSSAPHVILKTAYMYGYVVVVATEVTCQHTTPQAS